MALVECLTLRRGLTVVDVKEKRFQFMPIAGSLEDEETTSVADISDQETLDYLLGNEDKKMKGRSNFRRYNSTQAYNDLLDRRAEREKRMGRYRGFSYSKITVHGQDKGYMIVDKRSTRRRMRGLDGEWVGTPQEIKEPFQNMTRRQRQYRR